MSNIIDMNIKQLKYELLSTQQGTVLALLNDDGFYYYTYEHDGVVLTGKIAPAQKFKVIFQGNY